MLDTLSLFEGFKCTHIQTKLIEKARSVGQSFGYASDHFKGSRNERIRKDYGPYFHSCLIYFFPSFKHMHLQTGKHISATQKSSINMIYKKRSDEWPNVSSKWKNKSRCSNKPYWVDYNDLEDEEAFKF